MKNGGDDLSGLDFWACINIPLCFFKVDPSLVSKPQPCIFDEHTVQMYPDCW